MRIKITRETKMLETLRDKLKKVSKASVESGYFPESGIHEDSGMSYAALMNLHETGQFTEQPFIPKRPVRLQTILFLRDSPNVWRESVSKYLRGSINLKIALGRIGNAITINAQSIFGTDRLTNNAASTVRQKGRNEPLVDTGDLRDAWDWKIKL